MRTPSSFRAAKRKGEKLATLTAYDSSFAQAAARAGCDSVLVGDSLGMVIQGQRGTTGVTVDDVAYHVRCVAAGAPDLHVMADLPFGSFEAGPAAAFKSAARLVAAGAHMVKVEGGAALARTVGRLVERGVPVCGHVGLLPQSANATGFRVQGKDRESRARILADAKAISDAGAALLVLEMIPAELAAEITAEVAASTIGIGAGASCDGQILVLQDLLGLYPNPPRFAKNFLRGKGDIDAALAAYVADVRAGRFPDAAHTPA
ncbi:MAG: 3-methyl-2-oxobutanoate hydroxymethyltransferase [Betaproteobacteria bacterium AqS2]|uniref:3-methyl-2-oxobutanoate hydroxymethyltransferase n=1 Tax=Candidatus Amphirhobacter heronislandensis TaxID=1732024 RepID=A0A930UGH8_9GAMM|nr:3-methyl-2-oxobutanoate hydroxymethyltransferase [Betaproteobacteria bacterium AqS2]